MKSRRTKATDIPKKVKDAVWKRDNGKCVICKYYPANPTCHILSRAHGGRGIETNIVTLCNEHHRLFDSGTREQRDHYESIITAYMKIQYGEDWCKEDQAYSKW
jgi:5-methylcytosine-specific restriction endonuclease McrA